MDCFFELRDIFVLMITYEHTTACSYKEFLHLVQ